MIESNFKFGQNQHANQDNRVFLFLNKLFMYKIKGMCFLNFFYLKKKLQINQYFFLYISIKNNIYLFIIYFFGFFSILFLLWNPPPSLIWLLRKSEFSFSKLLSLSLPTNSFFSFLFRESSFALPICACVSVDPALILSNSHTRCVLRPFNFFFS